MHAAWWTSQWWALGNASCTVEEREAVVEYSIAVLLYEYIENLNDVAQTGTVSVPAHTSIYEQGLLQGLCTGFYAIVPGKRIFMSGITHLNFICSKYSHT